MTRHLSLLKKLCHIFSEKHLTTLRSLRIRSPNLGETLSHLQTESFQNDIMILSTDEMSSALTRIQVTTA